MKPLILTILLAVCAFGQSPKEGKTITDWKFLGEKEQAIKTYFAPGTVKRGDDIIKVWMRADFPNGGSWLFPMWHGDEVGQFRGHVTLDCGRRKIGGGSLLLYGFSGQVLVEKKLKEIVSNAEPTSIGWSLFQYFCEDNETIPTGPPTLKPNR